MFLPGFLISLATLPGVMVHELAHQIFCYWTGTPVHRVCYFRLGNPAGYVIHGRAPGLWQHILIGVGPFFLNSFTGLILGFAATYLDHRARGLTPGPLVLYWLAVSIGMHAFPSTGDARSIWSAIWEKGTPILPRLVGTPVVGVIYLGAFGSIFWLDLAYGALLVLGVPAFFRA